MSLIFNLMKRCLTSSKVSLMLMLLLLYYEAVSIIGFFGRQPQCVLLVVVVVRGQCGLSSTEAKEWRGWLLFEGDGRWPKFENIKQWRIDNGYLFIACIVSSRGASQLGGPLIGIPPGYKANKLIRVTKLPTRYNKNTCLTLGKHSLFLLFVWLLFYAVTKHLRKLLRNYKLLAVVLLGD